MMGRRELSWSERVLLAGSVIALVGGPLALLALEVIV
jgi:hypothetical protein